MEFEGKNSASFKKSLEILWLNVIDQYIYHKTEVYFFV